MCFGCKLAFVSYFLRFVCRAMQGVLRLGGSELLSVSGAIGPFGPWFQRERGRFGTFLLYLMCSFGFCGVCGFSRILELSVLFFSLDLVVLGSSDRFLLFSLEFFPVVLVLIVFAFFLLVLFVCLFVCLFVFLWYTVCFFLVCVSCCLCFFVFRFSW